MKDLSKPEERLEICRQRVEQLETCYRINALLNSEFNLASLLDTIMETAKQVMQADACSLLLLDPESGDLVFQVAIGGVGGHLKTLARVKVGEGIAGTVAQTGESLIVKDAYEHPRFNPEYDRKTGFKTGAVLCAPLKAKGEILGVCQVIHNRDGQRTFFGPDLNLFEMFCGSAALAIQNARVHQILLERQKSEKDMEFARSVQESFLPSVFPRSERFRFAARFLPARQVGGDFYDFIPCGDDSLAVVMGDVSGKGVSAALHMARLMSDFRFVSQHVREPQEVLTEINGILCARSVRGIFVTALFLRIDLNSGVMQAANAGHLPILLANTNGQVADRIHASGAPLGVLPGSRYSGEEIALSPGDRLLLFTDGVTEPKNADQEAFGTDRLKARFSQNHLPPQDFLNSLVDTIRSFAGASTPPFDDLTLVAIESI
jgi:sigma-B regulation protein RsbU (phosphoserine phosphatase)